MIGHRRQRATHGAASIRSFLARRGIAGIRVDRDERHLQSDILGLEWRPEYVDAPVLRHAIAAVPEMRRDAAYAVYLADERDSATPVGMVSFLHALASGALLSPQSSKFLLDVMRRTLTFPDRLGARIPPAWQLGHKTGTSSTWKGVTAATNDVGILTAPDGGAVAVAALVADSRRSEAERAALIAAAGRTVAGAYR
jgi:beta-lactamase class A